jgi:hypothetical protein
LLTFIHLRLSVEDELQLGTSAGLSNIIQPFSKEKLHQIGLTFIQQSQCLVQKHNNNNINLHSLLLIAIILSTSTFSNMQYPKICRVSLSYLILLLILTIFRLVLKFLLCSRKYLSIIKELSMCIQAGEPRFKFAADDKADFLNLFN